MENEEVEVQNIEEPKEVKSNGKGKIIGIVIAALVAVSLLIYFLVPWNILLSKNKLTYSNLLSSDSKSVTRLIKEVSGNSFVKILSEFSDNQSELSGNYKLGDQEFDLDLVYGNEFMAVKSKSVYDNFILFDINNLSPLWEALEVEGNNPDKLITQKDVMDVISLDKSEQKTVENSLKKYAKLILTELDESNFVVDSNAKIEGYDGTFNSIGVKLSNLDLIKIGQKILVELKSDKALDLIIKKSTALDKLYDESGYEDMNVGLTKEDIIEALNEALENLAEQETKYDESSEENKIYYIIRYYYDSNNKPVRREVVQGRPSTDKFIEDLIIGLTTIDKGNEKDIKYTMLSTDYTSLGYENYEDIITTNGNKTKHTISYLSEGYAFTLDDDMQYKVMPYEINESIVAELDDKTLTITSPQNETLNFVLTLENKDKLNFDMSALVLSEGVEKDFKLSGNILNNSKVNKQELIDNGGLYVTDENVEKSKEEFAKIRENLSSLGLFTM
ncbi:MAG: hypothetical protein IJS47_02160 [Clostridia bacterium]|nr:hypothetical protein [Clostridia bacterium]